MQSTLPTLERFSCWNRVVIIFTLVCGLFFLPSKSGAQLAYPKYVNTGNSVQDQATYQAALATYDQQKQKVLGSVQKVAAVKKTPKTPAVTSGSMMRTASQSCMIPTDATWSSLAGNDDGSTEAINLGFNFDLYGTTYNQVFINNNGNITFGNSTYEYSPQGFPYGTPMIAGFWDDIDTRTCGTVRWKLFNGTRLVVSYEGVGKYYQNCSGVNSFQIVIGTNNDPLIGFGQNVKLYYGDMQWTNGQSTVGINSGNGTDYVQVGRFGVQGSETYDGGGGNIDGLDYLDYQCFSFNVSSAGNQPPSLSGFPTGNTVSLGCGQTATYTLQSLPPEVNQTVTLSVNTNGMCGVNAVVTNGAVATATITVTGSTCNTGTNQITVTATDNGNPALTTTQTLTVVVGFATPTITGSFSNICPGGNVTLTSSLGSSYQWYKDGVLIIGATNQTYNAQTAGSYKVSITNGICTVSSSAYVINGDTQAPSITCPSAKTLTSCTTTIPDYTGSAVVSDNCSGAVTVTQSPVVGTAIAAGTTVSVTLTAKDATGNSSNCSFTVTRPVAPAPAAITSVPASAVYCTGGSVVLTASAGSSYKWFKAGVEITGATSQSLTVNATNGAGSYSVMVTDATGCSTTSAPVNVISGGQPLVPVVTTGSTQTICAGGTAALATTVTASNTTYTWSPSTGVTPTNPSGSAVTVSPSVTTTYFVTATNANGCSRTSTTSAVVTVYTPPVLSNCPSDITTFVSTIPNQCGAIVNYTMPTVTGSPAPVVTPSMAPGSLFPVGTTTVTIKAVNSCGTVTCSFKVTVIDNTTPVITCPAPLTVSAEAGVCGSYITVESGGGINNRTAMVNSSTAAPSRGAKAGLIKGVTATATNAGARTVAANLFVPTVTDNCAITPVGVRSDGQPMSAIFPVGTTTITWTATDAAGHSVSCQQVITVTDNENPVITCPSNVTKNADAGKCGAVVTYTIPYSDNCSATLTQTAGLPSGSLFPVGVTTNTFVAKDASGNTATCSFTVTVSDNQSPVLVGVPASTTVECDAVPAPVNVTATDNCTTGAVSYTEVRTNGSCASNYTLTRTWSVTDASNNTTTASQVITVRDTKAPVLSAAPADATVECDAVPAAATLTATDNCDNAPVVTYNEVRTNGNCPSNYTLTRTWTATDACGNTSSKTQIITVQDTKAPVLSTAPINTTVECDAVPAPATLTASDNCDASPVVTYTEIRTNGSCPSNYTLTRTWTAKDACGNTSSRTQIITVKDTKAPVIVVPAANIVMGTDAGQCTAIVNYGVATATDNCGGDVTISYSKASGTVFASGTTVVTVTATDACGNVATKTFNVIVNDSENPTLTCPGTQTVNLSASCDATLGDYRSLATVSDNCTAANAITITQSPAAGTNLSGVGTTVVTLTAIDAAGNWQTCTFNVERKDVTPPSITCVEPITVTNDKDSCGAVVTYAMPTASDNCGGSGSGTKTFSYSGSIQNWTVPAGVTSVTITAKGAQGGNSTVATGGLGASMSGTFNVTPGQSFNILVGQQGSGSNYAYFVGGGGGGGSFVVDQSTATPYIIAGGGGGAAGACCGTVHNGVGGVTTIKATDGVNASGGYGSGGNNGNGGTRGSNSQQSGAGGGFYTNGQSGDQGATGGLAFLNGGAGGATAGGNVGGFGGGGGSHYGAGGGGGGYSGGGSTGGGGQWGGGGGGGSFNTGTNPANAASVNSGDGQVTITWTASPVSMTQTSGLPSGSLFPVGVTTNTFEATDASGNKSRCSFTVTVKDTQVPVLVGVPANTTVECDAVPAPANVTATDNCTTGAVTYSEVRTNGSNASNYILTRTWSVTDASNNTITASQLITVRDTKAPVLSAAPADATVECDAVPAAATLTATDNCDNAPVVTYNEVRTNGSCPSNYTLTRTWTATDASGNTSSRTQVISVQDTQAPVLSVPASITQSNDAGICGAAVTYAAATATDNCSTYTIAYSKASGTVFPVGTTTVTVTATDACGNASTNTFTVTVNDTEKPVLVGVPANTTVECDAVPAAATLTATDNCDNTPVVIYSEVRTNGSCASNYTLTRTWTATDASGNTSSRTQTVTVRDTKAPVITPIAAIAKTNDKGLCGAVVNFGTTAIDNCGTATVSYSQQPGTVFPQGTTTVVVKATDACGNVSTMTFDVTVTDNEAPVVTCAPSVTASNDPGKCEATVMLTAPQATDNCEISSVSNDHPYNVFPVGTTVVTWTVADVNGNSTNCTQTVTVTDKENPVISCSNSVVKVADAGKCGANVTVPSPMATDNCGISTIVNSFNGTSNASGFYPVGTTTILWIVTDVNGNTNTCSQTVTVTDGQNPTVTAPASVAQCDDLAGNNKTLSILATDNCGVQSVTYTLSGATTGSGTGTAVTKSFAIGVTTITWTVTDVNGNTTTKSATVTVYPRPTTTITVSTEESCNAINLSAVSSQGGAASYEWVYNGSVIATTQNLSLGNASVSGVYSVYVTNAMGCKSATPATYTYDKTTFNGNYTIVGLNKVTLGENNNVKTGSVGVTSASGSASFATKDSISSAGAFVQAPAVTAASGAYVPNKVYSAAGFTMPAQQTYTGGFAGLNNYTVPANTTATLSSNYATLYVTSGSTITLSGTTFQTVAIEEGAKVTFTNTTLNMETLIVGNAKSSNVAKVSFANNTAVRITKQMIVGEKSVVNSEKNKVTIYIGDEASTTDKFIARSGAQVYGTIYVPTGTIKVSNPCTGTVTTTTPGSCTVSDNNYVITYNGYVENANGTYTLNFSVRNMWKYDISHIAFELCDGTNAISPTSTYSANWKYSIENGTNNPYRCIKFAPGGSGYNSGASDNFSYTVSAAQFACMTTIRVQAKAATQLGNATFNREGCGGTNVTTAGCGPTYLTGLFVAKEVVSDKDVVWNGYNCTPTTTTTDTSKPVITCPAPASFCESATGTYTISSATASDNSNNVSVSYTTTGATVRSGTGANASGVFNVGVTTVIYTAVDANGNTSICTSTVTVTALPDANITATGDCNSVTLIADAATSYKWTFNGNVVSTNQSLSLSSSSPDGVYSLVATNAKGCSSEAVTYTYNKSANAGNYTIVGLNSVNLGTDNKVQTGSVGVTSTTGTASFGTKDSVLATGAFVQASSITAGSGSYLPSKVYSPSGYSLPAQQSYTGGYTGLSNYTVSANTTVTLNGNYAALYISKGATVTLGGTTFKSVTIEEGAKVTFTSTVLNMENLVVGNGNNTGIAKAVFANNTAVRISSQMVVGGTSVVNTEVNNVTFYLGNATCTGEKVLVKGGAKVYGTIYAPTGVIKVQNTCTTTTSTVSTNCTVTNNNYVITYKGYVKNSNGTYTLNFSVKNLWKYDISHIAFELCSGTNAITPTNSYSANWNYAIENGTNNPFRCIKFAPNGSGYNSGASDNFSYTVSAAQFACMTTIRVQAKAATQLGNATFDRDGCSPVTTTTCPVTYMTGLFVASQVNSDQNTIWNGVSCTTSSVARQATASNHAASAPEMTSKSAMTSVLAYPNPNRGQFNLQLRGFAEGAVMVSVIDANGKTVLTQEVLIGAKTQVASFGVQNLADGIYNVKVTSGKQAQFTKVVIAR